MSAGRRCKTSSSAATARRGASKVVRRSAAIARFTDGAGLGTMRISRAIAAITAAMAAGAYTANHGEQRAEPVIPKAGRIILPAAMLVVTQAAVCDRPSVRPGLPLARE